MVLSRKKIIWAAVIFFIVVVLSVVGVLVSINRPKITTISTIETPAAAVTSVSEASLPYFANFEVITPSNYIASMYLNSMQYSIAVPTENVVVYSASNDSETLVPAEVLTASQDLFTQNGFSVDRSGDGWAQYVNESVVCRVDVQANARATTTYACATTVVVNDEYGMMGELLALQTDVSPSEVRGAQVATRNNNGVTGALITVTYSQGDDQDFSGYQLFFAQQAEDEWTFVTGVAIEEGNDGKSGIPEAVRAKLDDSQWNGTLLDLAGEG